MTADLVVTATCDYTGDAATDILSRSGAVMSNRAPPARRTVHDKVGPFSDDPLPGFPGDAGAYDAVRGTDRSQYRRADRQDLRA